MSNKPVVARVLILAAIESVLVLGAIYAWYVTDNMLWLIGAIAIGAAMMAVTLFMASRSETRPPKPPSIVEGGPK
jgi:hypothetical protein